MCKRYRLERELASGSICIIDTISQQIVDITNSKMIAISMLNNYNNLNF